MATIRDDLISLITVQDKITARTIAGQDGGLNGPVPEEFQALRAKRTALMDKIARRVEAAEQYEAYRKMAYDVLEGMRPQMLEIVQIAQELDTAAKMLWQPPAAQEEEQNRSQSSRATSTAARRARGGTVSDWISVEERLPEKGQIVDVWNGRRHTEYRYIRAYKGDPGNNFWNPIWAGVMCLRNVTHWRPLPEPPATE